MENKNLNLNSATFVGIDAHREEHTALAINRFEEEKGRLTFANTKRGVNQFVLWLTKIEANKENLVIGLEGGSNFKKALVSSLVMGQYSHVYEVNPLYTKQRRDYGTKGDKSDIIDAKLVAEVLTRKLNQLPRITKINLADNLVCLKKTVWFYEGITKQQAKIKVQLRQLIKERKLTSGREEKNTLNFVIREKQKELRRIRKLQERLKTDLDHLLTNQGKNLTTIKGVSTILAAKIVAHTGGIQRFSRQAKFIKYAGIAPLEKSSGKTKRHTKSKKGNRKLNSAFYLMALNQQRWNPKAQKYFQKKIKEGKSKKQALRCLMRRAACITYGLLKSGEKYRG